MQTNVLNYVQLGLIFTTGFLLSRIFIKCGIAEQVVFFFIKKSKGKIHRIIIYIVYSTSLMSMFIPNIITVLSVLPVINILVNDLDKIDKKGYPLRTSLAMANLYGANIGGTGSINGTISNAIVIGFLFLKGVKEVNNINFISWLGWGLPFVLVFCALASLMLILFLLPKNIRKTDIDFSKLHEHREKFPHKKLGTIIAIVTFGFWLIVSAVNLINPKAILPYTTVLAGIFMIAFLIIIFLIKFEDKELGIKQRVLVIKDFYSDLPIKGFVIAGIAMLISGILIYLKFDRELAPILKSVLPEQASYFLVMLIFTTFAIYLSEFVSNTTAAISLYLIAFPVCNAMNLNPFGIMMGITIVSTVTMMSPLANAVNALAYGGVKHVSLKRMMRLGFFMNLIGIILTTLVATYVLPWYFG